MLGFLRRLLSPMRESVARSAGLPGVELYLEKRLPLGESLLLRIHRDRSFSLRSLDDDLAQIGWERCGPDEEKPAGKLEVVYFKQGSGQLGEWSRDEARRYVPELRNMLSKHGFHPIPIRRCPAAI